MTKKRSIIFIIGALIACPILFGCSDDPETTITNTSDWNNFQLAMGIAVKDKQSGEKSFLGAALDVMKDIANSVSTDAQFEIKNISGKSIKNVNIRTFFFQDGLTEKYCEMYDIQRSVLKPNETVSIKNSYIPLKTKFTHVCFAFMGENDDYINPVCTPIPQKQTGEMRTIKPSKKGSPNFDAYIGHYSFEGKID